MRGLKRYLRQRLTTEQIQALRRTRERFAIANMLVGLSCALPTSIAVTLRERVQRTGLLDYTGTPIHMALNSRRQIARLNACTKEPETVAWIEHHLRRGDVFYDIGANVGAYSFIAHAVAGGRCTIYSFEPSFATFAALTENIALNCCSSNITPFQIALSDKTALTRFYYRDTAPGAAEHWMISGDAAFVDEATAPFVPTLTQTILTFRLDDLVRQFGLRPPNLIKLDVDGPEVNVLRGAGDLLEAQTLRSVLVEIDESLPDSAEIHELLHGKGFRLSSRYQRGANRTLANHVFERLPT